MAGLAASASGVASMTSGGGAGNVAGSSSSSMITMRLLGTGGGAAIFKMEFAQSCSKRSTWLGVFGFKGGSDWNDELISFWLGLTWSIQYAPFVFPQTSSNFARVEILFKALVEQDSAGPCAQKRSSPSWPSWTIDLAAQMSKLSLAYTCLINGFAFFGLSLPFSLVTG